MSEDATRQDGEMRPPRHGLYPIRAVSRLTGVSAVTLRAWERRYGLIVPSRTAKGHRLYSDRLKVPKSPASLLMLAP